MQMPGAPWSGGQVFHNFMARGEKKHLGPHQQFCLEPQNT